MSNIRKTIGIIFAVSVIGLTILAILAIWGAVTEEVGLKALATLAVVFFSSLISLVVLNKVDR